MDTFQKTPPLVTPFNGSHDELVEAGEQVRSIIDSPGFAAVLAACRARADLVRNDVITRSARDGGSVAMYAEANGEQRGLLHVEAIARGVIANATAAADRLAKKEIEDA